MLFESFPARLDIAPTITLPRRLPYVADAARALLGELDALVLVGARPPVAYFADASRKSALTSDRTEVVTLAGVGDDAEAALRALGEALALTSSPSPPDPRAPVPTTAQGPRLTVRRIVDEVVEQQPHDAIVIDEGISAAGQYLNAVGMRPELECSYLSLTGGSCGFALAGSIGAAIAAPKRTVIAIVGDGSAMYNIQALATQARETTRTVTIILANDGYKILELEYMSRLGADFGPAAKRLFAFGGGIDWVTLAKSFGVAAIAATDVQEMRAALREAFAASGPFVVVAKIG